ncbi:hypothetical protein TWF225_000811 [Orbilia oligospora]|uniref:Uncharacterized protein n=1 Tax=Orbilia oligospora TaxID=2813651 RepID=A0A8H2DQR5_ORBOL|nr:hypothetical protein TWF225_000811 [Orbilia oligospora]KAF3234197.1 hypothetical protein TWF128_002587 [Orbilia oligospora]KAF3241069.1 hypothetical protein TWF217_000629 [Orbilia oligospora]KAF3277171.1 hypothetical protein TWF132_001759 [Orbilia oligospora]TGJ65750.1 hypothetical protein EYR41_009696 [Orbilia oligospora]
MKDTAPVCVELQSLDTPTHWLVEGARQLWHVEYHNPNLYYHSLGPPAFTWLVLTRGLPRGLFKDAWWHRINN